MIIKKKRRLHNSLRDIKEFREAHLTVIVGVEGGGKSSLATAINERDFKKNFKWRLKNLNEQIKYLQGLGFDNISETTALYHTNIDMFLHTSKRKMETNFTTFDKFGLPNADLEIDNYAPFSLLTYDEPEGDIDSREWKNLELTAQYGGLKLKRHKGLTLIFCVHNPNNIDKRIRESIRRIWFIYGKVTKSFFGLFEHTTWYVREYHSAYGLQFLYQGFTGEVPKQSHLYKFIKWKRFTYWGKIHNDYDPTAFAPNWWLNKPFSERKQLKKPTIYGLQEHRKQYGYGKQKLYNFDTQTFDELKPKNGK